MFSLRNLGLLLAGTLTGAAVLGAMTLIALDFAGVDGLGRAWSAVSGARTPEPAPAAVTVPPPEPLAERLKRVGKIDLFTVADVPGSPVKVSTGTAYANARDLAAGTPAARWCYAGRDVATSPFAPTVTLGNQKGAQAPVLLQAASLSADEARQLGLTPEALADLARRLCRFG